MPHPAMAQSNTPTLLNTGIFPVSGAFGGRLFGESWESSNLYWARLADEMGYSPVMLNVLVPDLTRHMVANIFATTIDDWPALLRAMEETGDPIPAGQDYCACGRCDGRANRQFSNRWGWKPRPLSRFCPGPPRDARCPGKRSLAV